jgi:CheY-like chemotaxis protein
MPVSKKYTKYDVFISYSHHDKDWVRDWLLPRLEDAGVKVCIDYRDFRPGALLISEIERCILQSRKTLLVLSPEYLASNWAEFEHSLIQSMDPAALHERVVPLLHILSDIPPRLKNIIYLDFTNPNSITHQFNRLLSTIGHKKAKSLISREIKKQFTVLVVDDDKNWLDMLISLADDDGFTVDSAENYSIAHQKILKSRDFLTASNLAVCVVDLGLSGSLDLDGLGLLAQCKILGIPTIAISSSRIEVMREDLQNKYGVIESFSKHPFADGKFIQALHKAIGVTKQDRKPPTVNAMPRGKDNTEDVVSILFLAADPTDASRLRLGEELREIQEKLQLAKLRDKFTLFQRMSARPVDISQALLDVEPTIVHFSGHGLSTGELCFESQTGKILPIQPDALAGLFKQFSNQVKCVVLNACYSKTQANAIANHIDYVIGMNKAIGDAAAISFAIGFYQALGAGRTIEEAFELGCAQISLQGISEYLTPELIKKNSVK